MVFRAVLIWLFLLGLCLGQETRFVAAAVHPANPAGYAAPSGCPTTPGLLRCTNVTLKRCIAGAYGVLSDRVVKGPDWIDADRFDIIARAEQPVGDKALMAMLQILLAERFKLVLHREMRMGETMALEVAKDGPKLTLAEADSRPSWKNEHDHIDATSTTIGDLTRILSRDLNLPVENLTGLDGAYDFTLRWNPSDANVHDREETFAILRLEMSAQILKQLGLTLRSRKALVETLVVDHAEKPSSSEN